MTRIILLIPKKTIKKKAQIRANFILKKEKNTIIKRYKQKIH